MSPSPHILAIHGINTAMAYPAWPWHFAAYVDRVGIEAHVETEHYQAGPFPRFNTWVVNPKVSKALANRVLLRRKIVGPAPVHILAHSNGGAVAYHVARRLIAEGVPVSTLVLVAAALHSDVEKTGIADWIDRGMVERVVALYSPADPVIRHLQHFPGAYGSLGARGWQIKKDRAGIQLAGYEAGPPFATIVSRLFEGFGHSQYFSPEWAQATYRTALLDMGFDLDPLTA